MGTPETPNLRDSTNPQTTPVNSQTRWVCETCAKICQTQAALSNHAKTHVEKPKKKRSYKSPQVTTPQVVTPQVTTPQVVTPQATPLAEEIIPSDLLSGLAAYDDDDDDDDEEAF